jgi:hypothetical protein
MKIITKILLISTTLFFSQNKSILIVNKEDSKPLIGIQFFADNGSFIGSSDVDGRITLDINFLNKIGIKSIIVQGFNYISVDLQTDNISDIISLEYVKNYNLEPIIIFQNKKTDKYSVKAFFRSWQLLNGKLIKYGDGIIDYHVPYAPATNNFETGVKSYLMSYRTFNVDSLKQKLKYITVPALSGYLGVAYIPKNDILKRNYNRLTLRGEKNLIKELFEGNSNVGFAKYDSEYNPVEIFFHSNQQQNEMIKGSFRKVYGKWMEIEKWSGTGNTRHPSYIFYSGITTVPDKKGSQNYIETIKEIFIQEDINTDYSKPKLYKLSINENASFYSLNYWDEYIKKHPLPSKIQQQLVKIRILTKFYD